MGDIRSPMMMKMVSGARYEFPAGALEYKYMVDNFADQENLVDDAASGRGECAAITDNQHTRTEV